MRIWDIDPGYLNDHDLLGEHRDIHDLVSFITDNQKEYSVNPEAQRWKGHGWALSQRHSLIRAEMSFRGITEDTPVTLEGKKDIWPDTLIDNPEQQFILIKEKYINNEAGRIPFPENTQELWAQHKYSVMARDPSLYKSIGGTAAGLKKYDLFGELSDKLMKLLHASPEKSRVRNSLQHMWGYVSEYSEMSFNKVNSDDLKSLLIEIQGLSKKHNIKYLLHSTALVEIGAWL